MHANHGCIKELQHAACFRERAVRPAIPGRPPLPKNPIAVAAWEMQRARGAMNSPASTSQGWQERSAKLTVR